MWKNATNIEMFSQQWAVENPRAVIVLVHGQGEHIQRYAHVGKWFNQHGISVTGYDQQGFGQSGGQRGHATGLAAYVQDVGDFLADTRLKNPNVPLYLYGHSMGGNVCLNFLLRQRPNFLAGAIITAPWIQLAFEPPAVKIWVGKLLRNLLPALALPSGLDTKLLSSDPKVVEAYNNDPLVHDSVSAAAGIALMDGAAWLNTYSEDLPCKILLMHGGSDGITSAPASEAFASRVKGDITFKVWEGMFHEIHNEPQQVAVFETILAWMK